MSVKKVLITAGSTMSMIDKVRGISNVFRGKTGAYIANHFADKGYNVTLLTSDSSVLSLMDSINVIGYRTFDELYSNMETEISSGNYDVIIHSAAVSDYQVESVSGLENKSGENVWLQITDTGKVSSSRFEKLSITLSRAPKIVDQIRKPWNFLGTLVKFKLLVGVYDEELIDVARRSRVASGADLIVANCLEWSSQYAYILGNDSKTQMVYRRQLPEKLLDRILELTGD